MGRLLALTATMTTRLMRVLRMDITVRAGSRAASSSAQARGTTGSTAAAGAIVLDFTGVASTADAASMVDGAITVDAAFTGAARASVAAYMVVE
jgi:hypothetical protein